jgi:hypothetical protein
MSGADAQIENARSSDRGGRIMDQPNRRLGLAWDMVLCLAACGGGGGDANPDAGPDYLPLATGNRWVSDDGSGSRITGQRTVDGTAWWVSSETAAGGTPDGETLLASDAQGARLYVPASPTLPAYTTTLLRRPVVAGDRYPAYRLNYAPGDVDGNGTTDTIEGVADMEVLGFERVVTPAGTFDGAAHLRVTYRFTVVYQPSGTREDYSTGTADFWYAPDIGPVRFSSSFVTRGVAESENRVLTGYRVGNRSGGTLPGP